MKLFKYLKEVFISSSPLAIIMAATAIIFQLDIEGILKFVIGYVGVVIGQSLFLTGIDNSIIPMGKFVGNSVPKLKKTIFVLLFGFLFGLLATAAEPAIAVLAGQVNQISPAINVTLFIFLVAFGTGVMVAFAIYRIVKNIDIRYVFLVLYVLVFVVVFFVPNQYISLAFDASGATTGDVSVPFILALGIGISHTIAKHKSTDESFGIIGIASVGSIITVFVYGMILGNQTHLLPYAPGDDGTIGGILLNNLSSVVLAIVPIVAVFLIFQLFFIKLPKQQIRSILLSSIVVFVGLFIFLSAIDYGFAFAGKYIGEQFMDPSRGEYFKWLMVPLGFVLGFAISITEPAVVVLGEQVEEITNGHITKRIIKLTIGISIGFAAVISIVKILLNINILYFLIPLYVVALGLLFFTPKLFVGLAFDSGGVTGGAITSAFLTPLTLGASQALGQDMLTSGLGMISFISVMPLIVLQIVGILYKAKMDKLKNINPDTTSAELDLLDDK
ncbi:MAG: DUF1538 domain-containing protein [Erysipelotrichaceae bacterium]|jgi:hypothetical protein|nr:DUF1538 domain-containing protein [Erysipelotrichaceae bacterium]